MTTSRPVDCPLMHRADAHAQVSGAEPGEENCGFGVGEPSSPIGSTRGVLVKRPATWATEQDHPSGVVARDLGQVPVEPVLVVAAVIASEVGHGNGSYGFNAGSTSGSCMIFPEGLVSRAS